jgi:adenylate cyclase
VFNDPDAAGNVELARIFHGKAVLVGSSAFGANDLRHLPFDSQAPGMYTHANVFHALDQNYVFVSDDWSIFYSLALMLLGFGSVIVLSRFKSPLTETLGTAITLAVIYSADYFFFAPNGYFIRLFLVLGGTGALYAWFTVLNVFHEAREKKKVRDAFSRYVAPEIVKQMLSNPDKLKVGGEKREITMLFSDVRDFTTISERLTAQELSTLLNIYMGRMTDILFESGGTLDKYIGDAMVGFWGAPLDLPDHAYHAVRGAKLMLEALPEINKEFEARKFPRINVGIGLNTGDASVGNMGSDKIFQYTALGDSMNLASRLESLTKEYGVNLMISEFTLAKLGAKSQEFRLRPLDLVQVKGKSKAVKIFEVIPNWSPWAKEDALLEKFREAYERHYLQRRFLEAKNAFEEILQTLPEDKATKRLLKKAEEFLANPPSDQWDGVTIFTTK